eukprot:Tbor_TRINITY_DN5332_c2_g5::TRINITY_DN5332_c2_g5_i1::g.5166::m.5166
MYRSLIKFPPKRSLSMLSVDRPIEVFRSMQLGLMPTPVVCRKFLQAYFPDALAEKRITSVKLQAMESQACSALLRTLFYERFLAVPARLITFDAEFTGEPNFTLEGPTEDIIELAAYCPIRGKIFSRLIKTEKKIPEEVQKVTGISNQLLDKEAVTFPEAWKDMVMFIDGDMDTLCPLEEQERELVIPSEVTDEEKKVKKGQKEKDSEKVKTEEVNGSPNVKNKKEFKTPIPPPTAKVNAEGESSVWYDPVDIKRIPVSLDSYKKLEASNGNTNIFKSSVQGGPEKVLLLSHAGRATSVTMLEWALRRNDLVFPGNYRFADSLGIIQDMHRKRPVTQDKHPPSYSLTDLSKWLKIPVPTLSNRAGPDAAMTWSVIFHTLDRYGDESLTPHQQLVLRFFEGEAVELMNKATEATAAHRDSRRIAPEMGASDSAVMLQPAGEGEDDILDFDLDSILKK